MGEREGRGQDGGHSAQPSLGPRSAGSWGRGRGGPGAWGARTVCATRGTARGLPRPLQPGKPPAEPSAVPLPGNAHQHPAAPDSPGHLRRPGPRAACLRGGLPREACGRASVPLAPPPAPREPDGAGVGSEARPGGARAGSRRRGWRSAQSLGGAGRGGSAGLRRPESSRGLRILALRGFPSSEGSRGPRSPALRGLPPPEVSPAPRAPATRGPAPTMRLRR